MNLKYKNLRTWYIRYFLDFFDVLRFNHIEGKDFIWKDTKDSRLSEKKPWRHFSLLSSTFLAFSPFLYVNRDWIVGLKCPRSICYYVLFLFYGRICYMTKSALNSLCCPSSPWICELPASLFSVPCMIILLHQVQLR